MTVLTGPPEIDGYDFLEPLGSGGFADVYLYEQELPRRTVAVKVLHGDISEPAVATFLDEANLMARLSSHPSIVTVLGAGILPEDQRPYIVMEHCPRGNLGARFRTETFRVQDALAMGVQLAGAVETAHRAGVLHRDIKPENVLITSLGRPALTDFGIASRLGAAASGQASGMSVPWSAPEVIDGSWNGPASDVYSLAATVYSLLAGRSPFELPEGPNGVLDYAWRIQHGDLPPTGRPDVPASLEGVLATAMSLWPHGRHTSALSFARVLQKVERELGLDVTDVDVLDTGFAFIVGSPGAGLRPVAGAEVGAAAAPASQAAVASLPTVAAGLLTAAAGLPTAAASLPGAPAPVSAVPAGVAPGVEAPAMAAAAEPGVLAREGLLADITLVVSPAAADALALDPGPSDGGDAPESGLGPSEPEPHDVYPGPSAVEVLGIGADAAPGSGPPPERRPVWPAVLIDLILLGAVAGAGVVYLLMLQ